MLLVIQLYDIPFAKEIRGFAEGTLEAAIVRAAYYQSSAVSADSSETNGQTSNVDNYALAALRQVGLNGIEQIKAINPLNGRVATAVVEEEKVVGVKWTDYSVVKLVCPSEKEALDNPELTASMYQAVLAHHSAQSDVHGWTVLASRIKRAGQAFENITIPGDKPKQLPDGVVRSFGPVEGAHGWVNPKFFNDGMIVYFPYRINGECKGLKCKVTAAAGNDAWIESCSEKYPLTPKQLLVNLNEVLVPVS